MKLKEIKAKPPAELLELLKEKRSRLQALRFAASSGGSKNVREAKVLRRDIARILTRLKIK